MMKIDAKLVKKASEGDKNAFSDLYYACYRDLYNFAYHTFGNSEEAEDIVSETFLEIWKGIGKLRNPDAFAPWAFKILSVQCKKEISRKAKRKNECNFEELAEVPAFGSKKLEEDIAEASALSSALLGIDAEERMIVVLSVLYGYTHREIGKMLGKPPGTVGSKLHRTYARLRKELKAKK